MPGTRHTTKQVPAYEPPTNAIARHWLVLVAGLLLTALLGVALRPVCLIDVAGADESAFGVRHQRRGTTWYHCEPWIRRVLVD